MAGVSKIKKEDIVNMAYEIIRENGESALSARELAKKLKCSIQPIFYNFSNMDDLKEEVYQKINEVYKRYMFQKDSEEAYKNTGMGYIKFARDYPEFFKIMFMKETNRNTKDFIDVDHVGDEIIKIGQKFTGLSKEKQKDFHLKVWIFTHGLATLVVTKTIKFTDAEIEDLITNTVRQMIKGYKMEEGEN